MPSRADRTVLPGVLAGLLAVAFGIQLIGAGAQPDLPPALAVGASHANGVVPAVSPVSPARVIVDRPLFAPRQSPVAVGAQPLMLGGASVAGTVAIRGRMFAVIRRANGVVTNMSVGGVIDGWRLAALRTNGAIFVKGSERREIGYGAAPTQIVEDAAPAE